MVNIFFVFFRVACEIIEIKIPYCLKHYLKNCALACDRIPSEGYLIAYVNNELFFDYFIIQTREDSVLLTDAVKKEGLSTIEWYILDETGKDVQFFDKMASLARIDQK